MKTPKKSTVNKLINRFDNELKNILMSDIYAVRSARLMDAIQNNLNSRLKAA